MKLMSLIGHLAAMHAEHGDIEVRTGGPEGDEITDVWFESTVPTVYIH